MHILSQWFSTRALCLPTPQTLAMSGDILVAITGEGRKCYWHLVHRGKHAIVPNNKQDSSHVRDPDLFCRLYPPSHRKNPTKCSVRTLKALSSRAGPLCSENLNHPSEQ